MFMGVGAFPHQRRSLTSWRGIWDTWVSLGRPAIRPSTINCPKTQLSGRPCVQPPHRFIRQPSALPTALKPSWQMMGFGLLNYCKWTKSCMTLRTLNYGNYSIFLIMGNAGFCPSTVVTVIGFRVQGPVYMGYHYGSFGCRGRA